MKQDLLGTFVTILSDNIVLFIIIGNLLLLSYTGLSQTFGYISYILFIILFIVYFIGKKIKIEDSENDTLHEQRNHKPRGESTFWIVNIVASVALIFIAERGLILSNSILTGFNPNLAEIQASLNPFSLFSGYKGNGQGFIIQSFFMNWETYLPISIEQYEKMVIITELFFYYFLAVLVSRTFFRVVDIRSVPEYIFSVIFGSFFVFNFIFRSQGFSSFIIGPIMLSYIIIKMYESLKFNEFSKINALRIGLAVSFAVFGDPRSLVYFFIVILGFCIGLLIKNRKVFVPFFRHSVNSFLVIVPMFIVMYFMTSFPPGFAVNHGRAGDYATLAFFSSGTRPIFIWDFMANWWSAYVASPPSIISVPSSLIDKLPTVYSGQALIVYTQSSLNFLWLFSLGILSILAIFSIRLNRDDPRNHGFMFLYIPFLLLFALTLGTNIGSDYFVNFVTALSTIPLFGGFWAVTISTPQFIDMYLSPFLIIFASYSILRIAEAFGVSSVKRSDISTVFKRKNLKSGSRYIVVFGILFIFLFSNWQFFDQNYLLGPENIVYSNGNHVLTKSSLYPANPPDHFLTAYNSLYNSSNLSYAVYSPGGGSPLTWDNGTNGFSSPGIPPNPALVGLLNKIVSLNASYLIPSLMNSYGVKYIFFDKTQTNPDWNLYANLESSNLSIVSSNSNYTIFEDKLASEIHNSPFSFSLESSSLSAIELLSMFNSLGINPALVNGDHGNLSFESSANILAGNTGLYYNSSDIASEYPIFDFNHFAGSYNLTSNSDIFSIGNGWNITRYNGDYYVNYSVNNGSLKLQKFEGGTNNSPQSVYFVYYGNNHIPIPSGDSIVFHYNFTYSYSPGKGDLSFYGLGNTIPLNASQKNVTVSGEFESGAGNPTFSFGFAIGNGYNGTFTLNQVNFSYTFLRNGMSNVGDFSKIIHTTPDTAYTAIYSVADRNLRPYTKITNYTSSPNGSLAVNLTGFNYLNSVAVFPTSFVSVVSEGILPFETSNYGSLISGNISSSGSFLTVSYSPNYEWKTSDNLKYIGINELGQQVYLVTSNGSFYLTIPKVMEYTSMDWIVAVTENIILPVLLFTPVLFRVRNHHKKV